MAIKSKKHPTPTIAGEPTNPLIDPAAAIELGFVIDESLSMQRLSGELCEAFNGLLAEQIAPNAFASLVFFNDNTRLLIDGRPIGQIPRLDSRTYHPAGNTALLDGIGYLIEGIGARFDFISDRFRVLVAIFTDGYENASSLYSTHDIAEMIAARQNQGWVFLFITPKSGFDFGRRLQIPAENIVDFKAGPGGIRDVIKRLSRTVKAYRLGDKNYARLLQA